MTTEKPRLLATTLDLAACQEILTLLIDGRAGTGTAEKGRFSALAAAIATRDQHFYNADAANPILSAPFEKRQTFQSDVLRRIYSKVMTRMEEHPVALHIDTSTDNQEAKSVANAVETWLQDGLRDINRRNGYTLQGFLAHGQMLHGYGVLRVREDRRAWPKMTVPGEDANPSAEVKSYQERKAAAPFPFIIDVPRTDTFAFVEDRYTPNGMGITVTVESIASLEYAQRIWTADGLKMVRDETSKMLTIDALGSGQRPERFDHSGGQQAWGSMRVAQISTADEWYELCACDSGPWSLVKSGFHHFGMTPAATAKATVTNHPDPIYRFAPFLLGLFRTKPLYDLERNLGRLLAEEVAVPKYWAELPNGQAWLDSRGEKIVFTADSALVDKMPAGAKLVKSDMSIDPAFIQFLERSKGDLDEAIPETGFFDFGANTQPNTAVMAQMQSNTEIANLKAHQAETFQTVLQAVVTCMARWAEDGDGVVIRTEAGKLVEPTADQLRAMTVEVKIEPNSGAQQVSKEQYLRDMSKDPAALYTTRKYLEDTGRENTDTVQDEWLAEKLEQRYWPQMLMQEAAKAFGDAYVLTPGLTAVGLDGKPADPLTVIMGHGFEALASVEPPEESAPPMGSPPAVMQPMPEMSAPTGADVGVTV